MSELGRTSFATRFLYGKFLRRVESAARVVVVVSLIAAFDISVPDFGRTISRSEAADIAVSGLLLAVDASDTNSYSGSGTTWSDLSGNGKHGTLTSAVVVAATGTTPRTLTTGGGKYASFPSGFSDFTSGITVQATLDFGTADNWERIIDFATDYNGGGFVAGDGDSSNNILVARAGFTSDLVIQFYAPRGSGILGECKAAGGITSGSHNYAFTVAPSGGSTTCAIYRDGTSLTVTNTLSRMPDNVTRTANFAAHSNWTADTDLGANYKSLFIYNRALSSGEVSANYLADYKPIAPTSLTSTSMSQTSAALSWSVPTSSGQSSIIDYVVEWSTNNSTWNTFADGGSTATTATVTGLSAGTSYWFRVSAMNGGSTGPASTAIQRTTSAAYVVTYDTQGGGAVTPGSWTSGSSLTVPTPTRAGYTFKGWSTTAAGSRLVYQTTTPTRSGNNIVYSAGYGKGGSDAAATLTSQGVTFDRIRYRMEATYSGTAYYADVAFDKWTGATISSLAIPDLGDTRTIKENVSNLSVDSNWPGFAGVASAVTTGTGKSGRVELWPWDYGTATSGISPAGNGSTYDSDDTSTGASVYGSFQVHNLTNSQTVLAWNHHGDASPDIGFGNNLATTHTDWTFRGATNFNTSTWKLQIYIGELYTGGSSFVPTNNSDFTLYAQWTPNANTVTYDAQGGSSVSSVSWTTGTSLTLPAAPTRAGYTFNGWYDASSGGALLGSAGSTYSPANTAGFTTYAQWTANTLNVTYDSQGGTSYAGSTTVTGGTVASSPGSPTRAGYVFNGWYAASTGGSALTFPYTHGRTTNFTLFAQWLANQSGFAVTGAPATLAYNSSVTVGTSGGNGTGAVVFATTTPGVCSVNSGTGAVSMLVSSGTCDITATKAADSTYTSAAATASISATKANQSALSVSGTSSGSYGATISLSTSGGTTGGAVTWSDGSSTACTVDASGAVTVTSGTGSCGITATMAGNTNYLAVTSSSFTVAVSRAAQSTLTVTSTTATYGQSLMLTTSGGSGAGSVSWSIILGTCTVSGSVLTPGNASSACTVRATKAADSNYSAKSSADTSVTIGKAPQSGFAITNGTTFTTGGSLALSTTGGQSTGSVSWSVTAGLCTLSGSSLSASRGGVTCTVDATKAGDTNYNSVSDSVTVTVSKIVQTLSFRALAPSPSTVGSTYTVTVDSDAFLAATVTVANSSSSVCTISAGVVSFIAAGTCTLSATQAGNDSYASASVTQSITVTVPGAITTTTAAVGPQVVVTTTTADGAVQASVVPTTVLNATTATVKGGTTKVAVTTTSTTTTVAPAETDGGAGSGPAGGELEPGEAHALVQGKKVATKIEHVDESLVMTLPNDVSMSVGRVLEGSTSAAVAADGVLRVYKSDQVDVVMTGLVPGTTYTVVMYSDPVELARGVVDDGGNVRISVPLVDSAEYGNHTLEVNGVGPGDKMVTTSLGFELLERKTNTRVTVIAMMIGILLALLGGRPVWANRRRRRTT